MNTAHDTLSPTALEQVRPDAGVNWTGLDELPFESIAERTLELEHEGRSAPLSVRFGKPTFIDGKGWCCLLRISAMGREHIIPAGGGDSVHALQMAMHMAHNELSGMSRVHKLSFLGTDDLGFGRVAGVDNAAAAAKCPVMGMSVSS